ncbi:MAG: PstS family phosphate ABC transporter substrate-binding protein [Chitinophagaceae bacterium]
MKGNNISFLIFILLLTMFSCNNKNEQVKYDSPLQGTIYISVDESFKPVINEEIKVYESTYPDAKIIASYKSEADCFRDLQKDSTRLIIVAKGLTDEEEKYYQSKLNYRVNYDVIAYDAVSVIVNAASPDSVFTMKGIKKLLTDSTNKHEVVVDGTNATSTVRFLLDSVLKGESFGKNVKAAQGSKAVLDYVSDNINAVGFVGSSWVGNDEDPDQKKYDTKIHLALLECTSCENNIFAKPSQATITYGQYPLVRPLYYILKENYTGLGTGFTNFMTLERGQLIFKRSYLVPAKMYFEIRKVI